MVTNARPMDSADVRTAGSGRTSASARRTKTSAVLITADDALWPQIGKFVTSQFTLKQSDSIEHLLRETEAGAAAVLIWDARGEEDPLRRVSELQQHSNRFAVLAIDVGANSSSWDSLIRTNQVVALVGTPISEGEFVKCLNKAGDEVLARSALLGEPETATAHKAAEAKGAEPPGNREGNRKTWIAAAVVGAMAVLGALFLVNRGGSPKPAAAPQTSDAPIAASEPAPVASVSEQLEDLLERAGQAMLDRRYMAPADNNALYFYRRVLNFDAQNGEAQQGLARLAELLLARAQSALDAHQFEPALQALETARSIKPDDPRTRALDARLANMRTELGSTQIQAALNAQNFDRAASLIDEASRSHAIGPAQTAQLRDALKRQRDAADISRFLKLAQARLQQDRLVDPPQDSAAYYLERARRGGAADRDLNDTSAALLHRVLESARGAIDQHRFADADRWIAEARSEGAGSASLASLQRDLNNARSLEGRPKAEAPPPAAPRAAETAARNSPADAAADVPASGTVAAKAPAESAPEVALVLKAPIRPDYPRTAALKGVEGWVELTFTVTADGHVSNARVVAANPAGLFDESAMAAIKAARYQPLSRNDPSVSRQAKLKLAFRLAK